MEEKEHKRLQALENAKAINSQNPSVTLAYCTQCTSSGCGVGWNRFLLLKGVLGDEFPGANLIKDDSLTSLGEFKVIVGDEVIFAKSTRNRYPEPNEIIEVMLKKGYEPRKRKHSST